MRDGIEILKSLARQREKFPNGFYASTVVDSITVGVSCWRGEVTTTYYLSLRKSEETLNRLKVEGVSFSLEVEKDETGAVVGEYYLVKEERKGLVFSSEILERFRALRAALEKFSYRSDWGREAYSLYPDEYRGLKPWAEKLVSLAGRYPLKILVYLDAYAEYTFEANSLFNEKASPPLRVFAGIRRRLSRDYSLGDSSVAVRYPSGSFLEEQNGIRVVYPLSFLPYDKAMKELRNARIEFSPEDSLSCEIEF